MKKSFLEYNAGPAATFQRSISALRVFFAWMGRSTLTGSIVEGIGSDECTTIAELGAGLRHSTGRRFYRAISVNITGADRMNVSTESVANNRT